MPKPRTKQARRPASRKAGGQTAARPAARRTGTSTPAKNAARRKTRTQRQASAQPMAQRKKKQTTGWSWTLGGRRKPEVLPGWQDLAQSKAPSPRRPRGGAFIEKISTVRFALLVLVLAASVTLYVGHVHATQELVAELQQVRRENLRLHLKLNRLRGDFDRATGPAVVYRRAQALGLEEGYDYGPTITAQD